MRLWAREYGIISYVSNHMALTDIVLHEAIDDLSQSMESYIIGIIGL